MKEKVWEPAAFTVFYDAYKKHTHRDEARAAWRRLAPNAELVATIMADLTTRQWPDDVQFVPNAATYLHKRRWLDEKTADHIRQPTKMVGGALGKLREAKREADALTPEQRAANLRKLREIGESIGRRI